MTMAMHNMHNGSYPNARTRDPWSDISTESLRFANIQCGRMSIGEAIAINWVGELASVNDGLRLRLGMDEHPY